MDTEYKEISAAPEANVTAPETSASAVPAETVPEGPKKKTPVWKWVIPILILLVTAAAAFLLINREAADNYNYIAELNYDNGGLVAYDSEHVYYLAPYDINSEDKYIVVYEVDPNGDEPRVICRENTIKTIRSADSELYCLGAKGSEGAPYLARIDKFSGKLTTLRCFSPGTNISYFLVHDSELFYCADETLYKGALESADPGTDAVLLDNCSAVHFSGSAVYYSSEDEILSYNLRSGKIQPLCSAAATQICRKGDVLFFMNSDGLFSVGSEGGKPAQLASHESSEVNLSSVFSLYNGNILYEYSTDIIGLSNIIDSLDSDKLSLRDMEKSAFMIGMAMLNGRVEYIGEDGGVPVGTERPVCFIQGSADFSDFVSGFYITPYQTYFSTNFASYSLVSAMKFN